MRAFSLHRSQVRSWNAGYTWFLNPADDAACVFLVAVHVAVPANREWCVVVVLVIVVVVDVSRCCFLHVVVIAMLLWGMARWAMCGACGAHALHWCVRSACASANGRECVCVRAMRRACLPARLPSCLPCRRAPSSAHHSTIGRVHCTQEHARTRTQTGTHVIVTRVLHSYCSRTHAHTHAPITLQDEVAQLSAPHADSPCHHVQKERPDLIRAFVCDAFVFCVKYARPIAENTRLFVGKMDRPLGSADTVFENFLFGRVCACVGESLRDQVLFEVNTAQSDRRTRGLRWSAPAESTASITVCVEFADFS